MRSCPFFGAKVADPLNGSNETVAKLWECLDRYRLFGVVSERDANLPNAKVQALFKIYEGVLAPNRVLNLLPRNQVALVTGGCRTRAGCC